jgi:hypothetical protein
MTACRSVEHRQLAMYSVTRTVDVKAITELPGYIRAWCCTRTGPGLRLGYSNPRVALTPEAINKAQLMDLALSPSSIGLCINDDLLLEWTPDGK